MLAIDVLLDRLTATLGEDKIFKLLEDKEINEFERLVEKYNYELNSDPNEIKDAVKRFENLLDDLNEILGESNYRIHKKALEELLKYGSKYANENALPKSVDTIFQIVNETRGVDLASGGTKKHGYSGTPIFSVRINRTWRVFYHPSERLIVGFDFEHKTDNHSDYMKAIKGRY